MFSETKLDLSSGSLVVFSYNICYFNGFSLFVENKMTPRVPFFFLHTKPPKKLTSFLTRDSREPVKRYSPSATHSSNPVPASSNASDKFENALAQEVPSQPAEALSSILKTVSEATVTLIMKSGLATSPFCPVPRLILSTCSIPSTTCPQTVY